MGIPVILYNKYAIVKSDTWSVTIGSDYKMVAMHALAKGSSESTAKSTTVGKYKIFDPSTSFSSYTVYTAYWTYSDSGDFTVTATASYNSSTRKLTFKNNNGGSTYVRLVVFGFD